MNDGEGSKRVETQLAIVVGAARHIATRKPTKRAQPTKRVQLEQSLARGAAMREKRFAGELRPGPLPEQIARGLAQTLASLGALFVDLGSYEPSRDARWKQLAKICDDTEHELLRSTIRR